MYTLSVNRHCLRLIPVEMVCDATLESIGKACATLLAPHFPADGPCIPFSCVLECRSTRHLNKLDVINAAIQSIAQVRGMCKCHTRIHHLENSRRTRPTSTPPKSRCWCSCSRACAACRWWMIFERSLASTCASCVPRRVQRGWRGMLQRLQRREQRLSRMLQQQRRMLLQQHPTTTLLFNDVSVTISIPDCTT